MQVNPAEISELIKQRIQDFQVVAEARAEGTVISVADGICRIHGLTAAMQGEMLEFPGGTFGLALNLERDSVGAVVLGSYEHTKEGDRVRCTGRIPSAARAQSIPACLRPSKKWRRASLPVNRCPSRSRQGSRPSTPWCLWAAVSAS